MDFYLVNTKLSKNGNKIKVSLDNHEFTVHKWQPYIIEGLQKGEHEIKIKLIDSSNKPILSRFNSSGKRKFNIKWWFNSILKTWKTIKALKVNVTKNKECLL